MAFVARRRPLADAGNTLRAFCAAHLASYKVPVRVIDRPELPKLPGTGKIDRTALRALLTDPRCEAAT